MCFIVDWIKFSGIIHPLHGTERAPIDSRRLSFRDFFAVFPEHVHVIANIEFFRNKFLSALCEGKLLRELCVSCLRLGHFFIITINVRLQTRFRNELPWWWNERPWWRLEKYSYSCSEETWLRS